MESNPMSGAGIFSNVQQPGMLGLEMSLHHHHPLPPPNQQNPHLMPPQHHHPMASYGHHHDDDADYLQPQAQQQPAKQNIYPSAPKSKTQPLTLSDDDEPGFAADNSADDGKRKMTSPWQRMKWTDNMVKLLIMVVFYIGDEVVGGGGGAASCAAEGVDKKKGGGGGGALQKKGKWKSVSRAMMERGFYVSPQQCEDKFNDLNKRYKRVNDILGKGTSCQVVENQTLLDSMDHLSPKMKEEVKKLLNSKHLFFREMCAYHNSCAHGGGSSGGGGGGGGFHHPPIEPEPCFHSLTENANAPVINKGSKLDNDDDDDDDESNDDDSNDDVDDDADDDGGSRDDDVAKKRVRKGDSELTNSGLIQELDAEVARVLQDPTKGAVEKRRWMKTRLMRLEEESVGIQSQSFEIEKQRLKWLKFSSKKEREMEKEKLTNERRKLENERMVLLIRQKEFDLLQHYYSNKKSDPSSITG